MDLAGLSASSTWNSFILRIQIELLLNSFYFSSFPLMRSITKRKKGRKKAGEEIGNTILHLGFEKRGEREKKKEKFPNPGLEPGSSAPFGPVLRLSFPGDSQMCYHYTSLGLLESD